MNLCIKKLSGAELKPYIDDLAKLRIEVFRDFPYLYDGDLDYEAKYLQTYVDSAESIIVLAMDGEKVIGASTGLPMEHETPEFQKPFIEHGFDPKKIFYCGESVLLKAYRGKGIYKEFFLGREAKAHELGRFDFCSFCCVQRAEDHPRRPTDYQPLDPIWNKFGYVKHPELQTTYSWKDLDEENESPKPMVFWMKKIA